MAKAAAQSTWSVFPSDLPKAYGGEAVAYGNGRFVACFSVSTGTSMAWSVDGTKWQPSVTEVPAATDIVFAGGAFWALSRFVGVWRSVDGSAWERALTAVNRIDRILTDGRSLLVTNYGGNSHLYSPDFQNWRATAKLPNTGTEGETIYAISAAYGAGRYAVSYLVSPPRGVLTSHVATTVDGSSWVAASGVTAAPLAGTNDRLVSLGSGNIAVSSDGITFRSVIKPTALANQTSLSVVSAAGRFFTSEGLIASTDGSTWTALATLPTPTPRDLYKGIAYGNGRFIAVGASQQIPGPSLAKVDLVAFLPAQGAPILLTQPAAKVVAEGQSASFTVTLENADTSTTFEWRRDGVVIRGASLPTLTLDASKLSDSGQYVVTVRNAVGSAASAPAQLTVVPAREAGRIVNLSILTSIESATPEDASFSVGFNVAGANNEAVPMFIRAAGPSLARFGIANPLADPRVDLYVQGTRVAQNDDWGGGTLMTETMGRVGAFPFIAATSKDAALLATASAGNATVRIDGAGSGAVLAEIYEATPAESFTAATPRLTNVSVLKSIRRGAPVTAGFVISGRSPQTILIRAVGPGLTPFGIVAPASELRLDLFRNGAPAPFATNVRWSGSPGLKQAFANVGAFALSDASDDAALLVTLEPGAYTAETSTMGAGSVLVELYAMP